MVTRIQQEVRAYGVRVLLSRHPFIRKLKQDYIPSRHGTKVWNSSWLLMDYLKHSGMPDGVHVMDIGCGWGLCGIFCAKTYNATVVSIDLDPEIFPFLLLHAQINHVRVSPRKRSFRGLKNEDLAPIDILIGIDICFWDTMIDPLKRLIRRALRSGVSTVHIADPGRSPFEQLAEYCAQRLEAEVVDWNVRRPRSITGRILTIRNPVSRKK